VDGLSAQQLEQQLRSGALPIIGRISQGLLLLDVRTLADKDLPEIIAALQKIATSA
jgi:seryl-tRNA(Sec) selenium transferase